MMQYTILQPHIHMMPCRLYPEEMTKYLLYGKKEDYFIDMAMAIVILPPAGTPQNMVLQFQEQMPTVLIQLLL
jgi:hypothetical protein